MNNPSNSNRKLCFPNGNLACSIKEFAQLTNISRSALYEAIKEGSLIARKHGARTVIIARDGMGWLESLPTAQLCANGTGRSHTP